VGQDILLCGFGGEPGLLYTMHEGTGDSGKRSPAKASKGRGESSSEGQDGLEGWPGGWWGGCRVRRADTPTAPLAKCTIILDYPIPIRRHTATVQARPLTAPPRRRVNAVRHFACGGPAAPGIQTTAICRRSSPDLGLRAFHSWEGCDGRVSFGPQHSRTGRRGFWAGGFGSRP